MTLTFTIDPNSYVSYSQFSEAVEDLQDQIDNLQPEQDPVVDPTADGTSVTFIDTISQNNHGVITPTKKTVKTMTGAAAGSNGAAGLVPQPVSGQQGLFLRGDGTWQKATYDVVTKAGNGLCPQLPNELTTEKYLRQDGTWVKPPNTTYAAGSGLALNEGVFALAASGASAGSYGPSANVTGNDNATINVPQITVDQYGRITGIVNRVFTAVNKDTQYSAGTGLSLSGTTFSLGNSGVTAGTYGPSANVTGNNGNTIKVPQITVDKYGRITGIVEKTYTSVDSTSYLPTSGGTVTGVTTFSNTTASSSTATGAVKISGGLGVAKHIYAAKVWNAVWNDIAECREVEILEGGRCVTETESGIMKITRGRLEAGCRLTSDTFGTCMGETEKAKTPVAIAGRVLAYPHEAKSLFKIGDAVCSGPDGTVSVMSRDEIVNYPDRIVGIVSEIPKYEEWVAGTKENPEKIQVNGRIWIYVR